MHHEYSLQQNHSKLYICCKPLRGQQSFCTLFIAVYHTPSISHLFTSFTTEYPSLHQDFQWRQCSMHFFFVFVWYSPRKLHGVISPKATIWIFTTMHARSFIFHTMCVKIYVCTCLCAHAYICYILTFISNYLSMYVPLTHSHGIIDLIL